MSKNSVALKMLSYLKKEESYIKDLRKFLETELFKLQIQELNLSSMLRNQLVQVQKVKMKEEEIEAEHQTLSVGTSSQNTQLLSTAIPSSSAVLEPLSLEPDLTMESDGDDDDDEEDED